MIFGSTDEYAEAFVMTSMHQPNFFDKGDGSGGADAESVVLYAFGEFQSRGKTLAGRELPLDRLRGALRRAAQAYGTDELTDDEAVNAMSALGALVARRATFFAKHPYRVTVPQPLAERALSFYEGAKVEGAT